MFKKLSLAVLIAVAIGLLPVAAWANTSSGQTGREFGQHVAQCAQLMGGFTGTHNPGMHHGFAGWNGMTCMP